MHSMNCVFKVVCFLRYVVPFSQEKVGQKDTKRSIVSKKQETMRQPKQFQGIEF